MTDMIATTVILVCVGATFLRHVLCHRTFRVLRSACASGFASRVLLRCRVRRCGGRVPRVHRRVRKRRVRRFRSPSVRMLGSGRRASAETWAQADELERRRVEDCGARRSLPHGGGLDRVAVRACGADVDLTRREEEVLALLPQRLHPLRDRARAVRVGRYGEDPHPQSVPQNGRNGKGRARSGDRGKGPCLGLSRSRHLIAE